MPVIVAVVCDSTLLAVTVNVPEVLPAGMVMLDGTLAELDELESATDAPPEGAAIDSVAVPVAFCVPP